MRLTSCVALTAENAHLPNTFLWTTKLENVESRNTILASGERCSTHLRTAVVISAKEPPTYISIATTTFARLRPVASMAWRGAVMDVISVNAPIILTLGQAVDTMVGVVRLNQGIF